MTNILLITPLNVPFTEMMEWKQSGMTDGEIKRKLDPKYPVGLLNIGAYVKANVPGVEVRIVDFNTVAHRYSAGSFDELMLRGIYDSKEEYDIIGISGLFSSNYTDMGKAISFFRAWYPNAIIVTGGHLASACYREWLEEFPGLDAVCYGEGEIPMAELAWCLQSKYMPVPAYLAMDNSWATRHKARFVDFEPLNRLIENLDSIPPYDLSMLQYPEDYINTNDGLFTLGTGAGGRDISMFATRGCRYHCSFCASQFVHGHKVRRYSLARIMDDISYYHKQYGMTSFPFLDDDFLSDKDSAMAILGYIQGRGFTSRIFNVQYLHMDREIIQALKATGTDRILITIDGLNESFLRKVVHKPANFKKAKEVIDICREEGVTVISNIIIGFPGETKEMIDEGVVQMLDMGADWYSALVAVPFRGSELYAVCKREGYLVREGMDYHDAVIATKDWGPDWIKWKAYEINLRLNFVENWNMRHGNWEKALRLFERVIEMAPEHAFAYYYGAICARELRSKQDPKYQWYRESYLRLMYPLSGESDGETWRKYFNLKEI